jgi:hypothetical protein
MATFKLISNKTSGEITITFGSDGHLTKLELELRQPLLLNQYIKLMNEIPQYEKGIDVSNLKWERTLATNERLSLFCRLYERQFGVKYQVSAADSGKMKKLSVDEKILEHYFRSDNFLFKGKHSVGNLNKYWNELRREYAAPETTSSFPNKYDREYERKLSPQQVPEYWQHLRKLGLKPTYDRVNKNKIIDWI